MIDFKRLEHFRDPFTEASLAEAADGRELILGKDAIGGMLEKPSTGLLVCWGIVQSRSNEAIMSVFRPEEQAGMVQNIDVLDIMTILELIIVHEIDDRQAEKTNTRLFKVVQAPERTIH